MQKVTPKNEETYDEDSNPLHEELEQIRQRRKQAEKELEEIRKLLQE
jgi:chaperonin cofactor prefoldin